MSNTANYNLKTWANSEITDSFNNFVFGVAGDVNSNMTKIDTQMKLSADGVDSIKSSPIKTILATKVSDSYYTSTISGYSAYVSGNLFILKLDVTCSDTLTLNINSLGTVSVMKYKADGLVYNVSAGDIIANVPVMIAYDGTRWIFMTDIKSGEISSITDTTITGLLKGASNKITQAIAGTDYADPTKMFYPNTIYGGVLSSNFDSIVVSGFYTGYGTSTGAPNTGSSWYLLHINSNAGTVSAIQYAYSFTTSEIYKRLKTSSAWGSWDDSKVSDVIRYSSQSITEPEKLQARTNIGAQAAMVAGTDYLEPAEWDLLWSGTWTAFATAITVPERMADYNLYAIDALTTSSQRRIVLATKMPDGKISGICCGTLTSTQLALYGIILTLSGTSLSGASYQVNIQSTPAVSIISRENITAIYGIPAIGGIA